LFSGDTAELTLKVPDDVEANTQSVEVLLKGGDE